MPALRSEALLERCGSTAPQIEINPLASSWAKGLFLRAQIAASDNCSIYSVCAGAARNVRPQPLKTLKMSAL